ncbi:aminotransferase class I/II-fold pyridoxal phosphate-dependent enzyme [Halobacillus seohaensis]|uniref:Aminotransferase class I/II-fold pyridoxal phosphate-dependent enzyme n=1 Tax=Halobacillus seohaensis TaxID=447421 RepID=A0ABW2EHD7_9BACI
MVDQQNKTPLYDKLIQHGKKQPISFHVPGHKFGDVFSSRGEKAYSEILKLDATEITGLDDLHGTHGVIKQAQLLASDYFESDQTHFLVNGTTSGNLAAILATCGPGETVIVQRNCHKSIIHGLELAGAKPVFLMPQFEETTNRFSQINPNMIKQAFKEYPQARTVILTYPDYFGRAYSIKEVIEVIHAFHVPVIVDEAHGVHFKVGAPFPSPSLDEGADLVTQSAHKMAPAMTMASFLHIKGERISKSKVAYYLQVFQSSSPSYPIMASLDLARYFLSMYEDTHKNELISHVKELRGLLDESSELFRVMPLTLMDDPLKITLSPTGPHTGFEIAELLESQKVYPELATSDQVLLTVGLVPSIKLNSLKERLSQVNWELKNKQHHGTIRSEQISFPMLQTLDMNYQEMQQGTPVFVFWEVAVDRICAEAVMPYPPGIPLIMKGERVTESHKETVRSLQQQKAHFQNTAIDQGIWVF